MEDELIPHDASASFRRQRKSSVTAREDKRCKRSDGKGWRCRLQAVDGQSMCLKHIRKCRERTSYRRHRRSGCRGRRGRVSSARSSSSKSSCNASLSPRPSFDPENVAVDVSLSLSSSEEQSFPSPKQESFEWISAAAEAPDSGGSRVRRRRSSRKPLLPQRAHLGLEFDLDFDV